MGGGGGGGLRIGGRGIGVGTIAIALVAGWIFGINPLTVLGLLSGGGVDAPQVQQAPAVATSTEAEWGSTNSRPRHRALTRARKEEEAGARIHVETSQEAGVIPD